MKKLVLAAVLAIGSAFYTNMNAQQISENALGLRVGDNDGLGTEVSYQRAIGGGNNRLEFDLGWRDANNYEAIKLVGLYQWLWNIEGGFNWYVGAGAGLGNYDDKIGHDTDGLFALIAGDIGIEYNFDFPLLLSLDFRPEITFSDYKNSKDFGPDIALGIRYQF
ncbi:hypothetical protein [Christiangramia salexigens]|uniref:Outer membrane protein beta-barrel domain-containing protein n=1 Tax=Christiangramia salexigens TaxID=1913577 RepID=A0A1L3J331_9FLAO|nr:hypothetical protein [Christiangramia salexigens]APG59534.1 hypothetical protein LPB144_03515 [Christiangramia salexigens]